MLSKYKIAVLIPTYNRAKLLSYTLESLQKQIVEKNNFQVVIADDGSFDNTRDVVQAFESKINLHYVWQEDRGYRPASARNLAINASDSEVCLFIDSGVLLQKDCLTRHIEFHEKAKCGVAIGYTLGFHDDKNSEKLLQKLINPYDIDVSLRQLDLHPNFHDIRDAHYKKYDYHIEDLPAPWLYFWTNNVSVPRIDLIKVGCFDENYDGRWGVEDNDLGFRLFNSGSKICLLPGAKSIHYPHTKDDERRISEGYLNCMYFHNKYQTVHTRIFLENFKDRSFVDINELCKLIAV